MSDLDFVPSRCPNRRCAAFRRPPHRFCCRNGSYRPHCRTGPVPRFRCKLCGRGFSRQTFRLDYRDKRPHANALLFQLLTSGVGLRQAARVIGLDVHAGQRRRRFGPQVAHHTAPSTLPRTVFNPLFAINLTDAMMRDNDGRLRRRSWLVSKRRRYLRMQLELFAAYRNRHRRRHNDDPANTMPGVVLQLCDRSLAVAELVAWRQDWRLMSPHPASTTGRETVDQEAAGCR